MERLIASPCTSEHLDLGESCRWDAVHDRLLWVDITTGRLFCGRPQGRRLEITDVYQVTGHLTAVAPLAGQDAGWIVAANQGFAHLANDGKFTVLAEPESGKGGRVRMNDGACDPAGRFWAGSMAYEGDAGAGSLYRYDGGGRCTPVLTNLTISNGLAWSGDDKTMYHVDSATRIISAFDYNPNDAGVTNRRCLVRLEPDEGMPDGLCLDAEDCLWVAVWGGSQVRRYTPQGTLTTIVEVAASQPSSCALGGLDARTLYITTAREDLTPDALAAQPDAGRLFCVEVGTPGPPAQPCLSGL